MEDDRSIQSRRMASLAQLGLAALVAGTLFAFSALAFRTAFDADGAPEGVDARPPVTRLVTPVVLPATTADAAIKSTRVDPTRKAQVLGIRISRSSASDGLSAPAADEPNRRRDAAGKGKEKHKDKHKNKNKHEHNGVGNGHIKARGEGHRKHEGDDWDGSQEGHSKADRNNGSKKR